MTKFLLNHFISACEVNKIFTIFNCAEKYFNDCFKTKYLL